MTATARRRAVESTSERVLAELVEEFIARREGGEAINPSEFAEQYPEHAEALLSLLPALEVMADLSRAAQANDEPGSLGAANSGPCLGVLGDFRILREVGRGGMGVVYEAEQVSLSRRVALKVLPFAAAMDPQQLRRFKTEAQAAAQLHHTHIVPVHSVGCERGVHYYAMQFIEGQTLAQAIAEQRRAEDPPPFRRGSSPSPPRGEGGPEGRMRGERDQARSESPLPSPEAGEGGPEGRMKGERDQARSESPAPAHAGHEGFLLESRLQAESGPAKAGTPTPTAGCRSPVSDSSFEPPPPRTIRSATPTLSSRTREYCQKAAALGIQAAEALDHAHKVGIVHRDIKPANLLLDVQGNLWVTDFGLARLQDDTGLTITGDLLGTLRYMSPEQALAQRGYLDHRTDIYSLGATLYELVTLRPAVDGEGRQEILRKIAQDEPIAPRQPNPAIPRELETILLKAMNKEPGSRYATAQELADDLRRFLEDKPIKAKRPTAWEHLGKWSRRHKPLVGSAVAVLVLAVVGMAVGMVLLARKQAELERQRDAARQAVDDMYTDVAEQWLVRQPALEPVQRAFLQKALGYYQRFAGEQSTDPSVRFNTAQAFHRVGIIQQKLSRFGEAEAAYRQELVILEKLAADSPSVPQYRSGLAVNLRELGGLLRKTADVAEGEQAIRRAIGLEESLVAESPSEPEYRNDLARSQSGLAMVLWDTHRREEAEQMWRQAIALQESLVAESPSLAKYQEELARSHNNFGTFMRVPGRYAEAERSLARAIALWAKLSAGSPSVPLYRSSLGSSHSNLGLLLEATDRPGEAEKAYRQAIAHQEKLVVDSPSVPEYRNSVFKSQSNLGNLLEAAGRLGEAEQVFRQAIAHVETLAADSPSVPQFRNALAAGYNNLGTALTDMGRLAEAEQAYRRAIALNELLVAGSPSVPDYQKHLAGDYTNLGDLLAKTGRPAEAEPAYRRAIALFEKPAGSSSTPDHDELARSEIGLATLLQAAGRGVEAEQEYRRAIGLAEKLTPDTQNDLAWALATSPNRGLPDLQVALRLAKNAVEREPQNGGYWNTLGVAHYRVGDWKAAIEALEKSKEFRAGGEASSWFFLAMSQWQNGEKNQARQWYDKAVEWMEKNKSQDDELRRFCNEAASLLGLTEHPTPITPKKEETPTRQSKP